MYVKNSAINDLSHHYNNYAGWRAILCAHDDTPNVRDFNEMECFNGLAEECNLRWEMLSTLSVRVDRRMCMLREFGLLVQRKHSSTYRGSNGRDSPPRTDFSAMEPILPIYVRCVVRKVKQWATSSFNVTSLDGYSNIFCKLLVAWSTHRALCPPKP